MKYKIKKNLCILVAVIMCSVCLPIDVIAVEDEFQYEESDMFFAQQYQNTTPSYVLQGEWYVSRSFPINPDSEDWMKYGLDDILYILNPPEDILHEFSSQELADLMMNYPQLWVLTAYEYEQKNIFWDYLANNCSIYNELLSRKDGVECLLNEYLETDFNAQFYNDNPYVIWGYNPIANAEVFGCQFVNHIIHNPVIYNSYFNTISKVIEVKSELYSQLEKSDARLYLSFGNDAMSGEESESIYNQYFTLDDRSITSDGFTATGSPYIRSIENVNIYFTPGVYHKYGTDAACLQWYSGNYTNEKRESLNNAIAYPWYRLAQASPKYNCHGYAWVNANGSNGYWMDSPIAYIYYGTVTNINENNKQTGDIIVMYNSSGALVHSAVICPTPSGCYGTYTVSKIGGKGLYRAPLTELMTYYCCTSYLVYRV